MPAKHRRACSPRMQTTHSRIAWSTADPPFAHARRDACRSSDKPIVSVFRSVPSECRGERINAEDARNPGLHFHPSLSVTEPRIVDHGVEAAELVDLAGNCSAPAIVARSPQTTPPAPGPTAKASRLRPSFRLCNTTSWPCAISSRAAMRPRPPDDPVMVTRVIPAPPLIAAFLNASSGVAPAAVRLHQRWYKSNPGHAGYNARSACAKVDCILPGEFRDEHNHADGPIRPPLVYNVVCCT